ncbi:MAG: hypothetical protein ACRDDL_06560 [Sarcina sp.]
MNNLENQILEMLHQNMSYRGILASFHGKIADREINVAFHGLNLKNLVSLTYIDKEIDKAYLTPQGIKRLTPKVS